MSVALHQADVALLNQVQQGEAATDIRRGDADDEAEVGLHQLLLGACSFSGDKIVTLALFQESLLIDEALVAVHAEYLDFVPCFAALRHLFCKCAFVGGLQKGCAPDFAQVDTDRVVNRNALHAENAVNEAFQFFGLLDLDHFDFGRGTGKLGGVRLVGFFGYFDFQDLDGFDF